MPKLEVSYKKILKLTNVLLTEVSVDNLGSYPIVVEQMENYIKSKGFQPVGPLIQQNAFMEQKEENKLTIRVLRQSNGFIHHVEKPYNMEALLRIPHCLYVRFSGDNHKLQLAYQKLMLTAYEEDIPLRGDSYTVFIEGNDETVTADIFMPRMD